MKVGLPKTSEPCAKSVVSIRIRNGTSGETGVKVESKMISAAACASQFPANILSDLPQSCLRASIN